METSYLKTLELDKIIARASEGCVCKEAREQLLALEPQCDSDEVRYALEQTDAINSLLIKLFYWHIFRYVTYSHIFCICSYASTFNFILLPT